MITLNEAAAVGKVVDEIRTELARADAEILVVDSSSDDTATIAEAKGARVVRQFPPEGYGRAMERALREARGDVVVTLDCDDTYPARRILEFAETVLSGKSDLVNGSRLRHKPASMPLANYLANRLFALTSRVLLGVRTTDVHSGMRAYRRSMLESLTFCADGPALPVELLLKPALAGYLVTEVFIPYGERIGVTSLNRWSSTVWTFKRILQLFRYRLSASAISPFATARGDR